jgi:2-aminobenzoate-CoA ligase
MTFHPSAHPDRFVREHLPPPEQWPEFLFDRPELQFPPALNCATELLDAQLVAGRGGRVCIRAPGLLWNYAQLAVRANRIANVLVHELGLVPGNRVLLRAPNNPMLAACWFGVVKAGGIAVGSMPLLRAKELTQIIHKAQISHALCDARLADELLQAAAASPVLRHSVHFNSSAGDGLEAAMARQPSQFSNVATAADDPCLIAFTSGTTGQPKGTVHFHRDVMAACQAWPRHVLRAQQDDVFMGSPPLAFSFGLGGLLLFPMHIGASTVLLEKASPPELMAGVRDFKATVLFTSPTAYRAMALLQSPSTDAVAAATTAPMPTPMPTPTSNPNPMLTPTAAPSLRGGSLRQCVSAGEALPAATRALWKQATGIELIDGIGATEMLHIFISHDEAHARPGATGTVVPGYVACVLDDQGRPLPAGQVGRLAVKGPTGCKYLADERQSQYVQGGWNITGDAYLMDADGYFHYQSRTDDMIISAGYNIAAPEVEEALMQHPAVAECAVIGVADEERGQVVKAFVVVRAPSAGSSVRETSALAIELQDFVKQRIAPYKYPRAVEFVAQLPRTETGKLQRFRLRGPA